MLGQVSKNNLWDFTSTTAGIVLTNDQKNQEGLGLGTYSYNLEHK